MIFLIAATAFSLKIFFCCAASFFCCAALTFGGALACLGAFDAFCILAVLTALAGCSCATCDVACCDRCGCPVSDTRFHRLPPRGPGAMADHPSPGGFGPWYSSPTMPNCMSPNVNID